MEKIIYNEYKLGQIINFYGSIHEYLIISGTNLSPRYHIMTNFIINHDGYKSEIIDSKNKIKRNLELEREMNKKDPGNIRWYYYLGREMFVNNEDSSEIIDVLNLGLSLKIDALNEDTRFFRLGILILLCQIYFSLDDFDKIEMLLNEIKRDYECTTDYYYFYHILNYNKLLYNIFKLSNETILNLKKIEFSEIFIHSKNYHILRFLGLSYITVENYDLAFRVLSQIKDEIYLDEIKERLLEKKTILKI